MLPDLSDSHVQALLHSPGAAVVPVPELAKASLATALKAFEGQLQSWSKQPPAASYRKFEIFPHKIRMQFRPGDANLGDIGVLQQLALEVRPDGTCTRRQRVFPLCSCISVSSEPAP